MVGGYPSAEFIIFQDVYKRQGYENEAGTAFYVVHEFVAAGAKYQSIRRSAPETPEIYLPGVFAPRSPPPDESSLIIKQDGRSEEHTSELQSQR